jgi:hypothetical protein
MSILFPFTGCALGLRSYPGGSNVERLKSVGAK